MNILVYGLTRQRAYDRMDYILGERKYKEIDKVIKNLNTYVITLKDGTMYQAITINDSARGYRWQYAVIDSLINKRIVDEIILPSFSQHDIFALEESYSFYD